MPKIIKDIEETIKKCALELFIDYGYDQVDMKMISKKSGVAVGTLYNYYANKKSLYTTILEESWEITFHKLDEVNELNISSKEKLKKFIATLYEEIEARKGLGKALVNNLAAALQEDVIMIKLKNNLSLRLESLINNTDPLIKCPNIDTRLSVTLLNSMTTLLELYPNNIEDNINFLVQLINLSIK